MRRRQGLVIGPKPGRRTIGGAVHHHAEARSAHCQDFGASLYVNIVIATEDLDLHRIEAGRFDELGLFGLELRRDGFLSLGARPDIGDVNRHIGKRRAAQKT